MTNSSLRRTVDDDPNDRKTRSFSTHHDRRQLLLKLIHHQMNSAKRFDPFVNADKCRQQRSCNNIDVGVHVNEKYETFPDPERENVGKPSIRVQRHDDDEISLDLEWTANFDSTKNLSQYRQGYLNAISYLLEDFQLHPQSSNHVFLPKNENEKCARIFSTSTSGSPPPSPAKEVRPRMHWTVPHKDDHDRPIEANSTCTFCMAGASSSGDGNPPISKTSKIFTLPSFCVGINPSSSPSQHYFSVITLAILLLGILMSIPYVSQRVFKFVNEIEWPWSMFMKEPLLKGFIYSANLNMYEEDFDWS